MKPASPRIRIAIDVSGWLHRLAAFATSAEVIAYRVVQHCWALINIGCDVTVVFDGETNSPCRGGTEQRARCRESVVRPKHEQGHHDRVLDGSGPACSRRDAALHRPRAPPWDAVLFVMKLFIASMKRVRRE